MRALRLTAALLLAALLSGGCLSAFEEHRQQVPLTPTYRLTLDTEQYATTVNVLAALRAAKIIGDDEYDVIDTVRGEVRKSLDDRRAAIREAEANDTDPRETDAYQTAISAFTAGMYKLLAQKHEGQIRKAAVQRAATQPALLRPVAPDEYPPIADPAVVLPPPQ